VWYARETGGPTTNSRGFAARRAWNQNRFQWCRILSKLLRLTGPQASRTESWNSNTHLEGYYEYRSLCTSVVTGVLVVVSGTGQMPALPFTVWSCANYCASLYLNFLNCKMNTLTSWGCWGDQCINIYKNCLEKTASSGHGACNPSTQEAKRSTSHSRPACYIVSSNPATQGSITHL
jgi:hypothetical protein